jgi:hypothetical protein
MARKQCKVCVEHVTVQGIATWAVLLRDDQTNEVIAVEKTGGKQACLNRYVQITGGNLNFRVPYGGIARTKQRKSGNGGILAAGAGLGVLSGIFNAAKKQG